MPIVVVLPVPLTPTTRMTLGSPARSIRGGSPKSSATSSASASFRFADVAARLEPSHELRRRGHADVAGDQRLLEPLPRRRVARVERRGGKLLRERAPAAPERVPQAREQPRALLAALLVGPAVAEQLSPGPATAQNVSRPVAAGVRRA